ncbi:MAG: hypothetical protein JO318_03165 [Chloroflexi bacterium]|nr:hypothetical protein [Chloroflexota bacterium]
MQILNEPWPWFGTLRGRPLSAANLISAGTLSAGAASLLWWAIQHGASVFVAAGPPGAGKSTLANALLEYLPENARVYVTSGPWDRIDLAPGDDGPLYLLVNELSAHMPIYLYGPAAQQAFALLNRGVRIIGTLHARSAAEALRVICDEGDIAFESLATPFVFAVIAASWQGPRIVRRLIDLAFLPPGGELVSLDAAAADPSGVQSLARWSGIAVEEVQAEIASRAAHLPA